MCKCGARVDGLVLVVFSHLFCRVCPDSPVVLSRYEAFVVYYFVGLILEYAGGDRCVVTVSWGRVGCVSRYACLCAALACKRSSYRCVRVEIPSGIAAQ
jgi:hypothetical protein